jgi:uncharacterized membrane protein
MLFSSIAAILENTLENKRHFYLDGEMKERTFMFDRDEHQWDGHPWGGHPWGGHPLGHDLWPGMLLSTLNTMLLIALFIGLGWVLLRWILPHIMPMLAGIFGRDHVDTPSLEILRQRYAAGEIDAVTFEQMGERLEASYRRESNGITPGDYGYQYETGFGYNDDFPAPNMREQGSLRLAEQYRKE